MATDYKDVYYGYEFDDVGADGIIPIPDTDKTVTKGEVANMISEKLNTIQIQRVDDDSIKLVVDGRESANIDDIYMNGVEQFKQDGETYIKFKMSNGNDPIVVKASELDDPIIDGDTY